MLPLERPNVSAEYGDTKNNAASKMDTPSVTVCRIMAGVLQQKEFRFGIITKAVGGLTAEKMRLPCLSNMCSTLCTLLQVWAFFSSKRGAKGSKMQVSCCKSLCLVRHKKYDSRLREWTADTGLEVMITHYGTKSFRKNVGYMNSETY